jgi:beta-lactamase class A
MRIIVLLLALLAPAAFGAADDAKNPADTPESIRAKQDLLWARMEDSVHTIVRETDAVVGVAILDLTDQRAFYLNADAIYPTASTIKIAVLAELYRQHERGSGAKLGDLYTVNAKDGVGTEGILQSMSAGVSRITNRDLALLMVSLSDNSATNVLIDRVGMDNVNSWLSQLGLERTRLRRHMLDVKAAQEGRENTVDATRARDDASGNPRRTRIRQGDHGRILQDVEHAEVELHSAPLAGRPHDRQQTRQSGRRA